MRLLGCPTWLLCYAIFAAAPARADLNYAFSFTPATTLSGIPIQPFNFAFNSPNFITGPASLNFTPFLITNGPDSVLINFGETALVGNDGCFVFSSYSSQMLAGCGVYETPASGLVTLDSPFPTSVGEYALNSIWALNATDLSAVDTSGTSVGVSELTISEVTEAVNNDGAEAPEPSAFVLFAFGLGMLAVVRRRVTASRPGS